MTYIETIKLLSNNIVNYFDEVYHSAEIVNNGQKDKFPAIRKNDGWIDLGPSDKKQKIYIRRNGDDVVADTLKIGSCTKSYKMATRLRIVYFRDHTDNPDQILYKMLQAVLVQGITLNGIVNDKWRLEREETTGKYKFGASSVYFAIDISVSWNISPDGCENDCCTDIDNPIKKC